MLKFDKIRAHAALQKKFVARLGFSIAPLVSFLLHNMYNLTLNDLYEQSVFLVTYWLHSIQQQNHIQTVKPAFKTTWEIGTSWELRTATSVLRPIQCIEIDLRNKTTSEFRTVFHSPLGDPNCHVPLYVCMYVLLTSGNNDGVYMVYTRTAICICERT